MPDSPCCHPPPPPRPGGPCYAGRHDYSGYTRNTARRQRITSAQARPLRLLSPRHSRRRPRLTPVSIRIQQPVGPALARGRDDIDQPGVNENHGRPGATGRSAADAGHGPSDTGRRPGDSRAFRRIHRRRGHAQARALREAFHGFEPDGLRQAAVGGGAGSGPVDLVVLGPVLAAEVGEGPHNRSFRGDRPVMSGNAARRSAESRSMTLAPHLSDC